MPGFLAPLAMSLLPSVLGKVFNFKTIQQLDQFISENEQDLLIFFHQNQS